QQTICPRRRACWQSGRAGSLPAACWDTSWQWHETSPGSLCPDSPPNVEIEVVMDDCSAGESTALLAVLVRKLNTDISSILPVHPVVRLAFLDTFASGNKRPARNAWTFLVQFIARGRQSLQLL